MTEIAPSELKHRFDAGEPIVLLDVREPDEIATASLPGATVIRMAEIPARFTELPRDVPIAVMCHHGARSELVTRFLNDNGYERAMNLAGGIDAWSLSVDPMVPRY